MQTEKGGKPSFLGKEPCSGAGPHAPGCSRSLKQSCVPSYERHCEPGDAGTVGRHQRTRQAGAAPWGCLHTGPRAQGVSDLPAPRDEPWLFLAGCRWLRRGESLLRGCGVPQPLGALIWRHPALVLSCPAMPHLLSLGPCSTMGKSNTWMDGESDGPGGAVPLPAVCLPPEPSFCYRRAR